MAFPVVAARSGGIQVTNTTTHSITLPTSITAGDMLLVVFTSDGNPTISQGGGGTDWTKQGQRSYTSNVTQAIFTKVATGGDTLTISTSASEQSAHISFRITGSSGEVDLSSTSGSSANSTPPALTPVNGARDYLWIVTRGGDTAVPSAAPTNFTDLTTQDTDTPSGGATCATSERSVASSSLTPTAFTVSNENWASYTLAISPSSPNVTASPSAGSVAITGGTPTASLSGLTTMTAGALTLAGTIAALAFTGPTTGALAVTGDTPTLSVISGGVIAPASGSISLTGQTPTMTAGDSTRPAPSAGAFASSGQYVGVAFKGPDTGTAAFTGEAPTAAVQTTGAVTLAITAGAVSVTGTTPIVSVPGSPGVPIGTLSLSSSQIRVGFQGPTTGALLFTSQAPNVAVGTGTASLAPDAGSGTVTGVAPNVHVGLSVAVSEGTLTLTGTDITVCFIGPNDGAVSLTGYAPTLVTVAQGGLSVGVGTTTLTGETPALSLAYGVPVGGLGVTSEAPSATASVTGAFVESEAGAGSFSGAAPALSVAGVIAVEGAALTFTMYDLDVLRFGTAVVEATASVEVVLTVTAIHESTLTLTATRE